MHLALRYSHTEAVLSVEDTGVGIPTSDLNLVGERFHRVQSVSRSHEGTGIGLALVKELVKLHGGKLGISSKTAVESSDGSRESDAGRCVLMIRWLDIHRVCTVSERENALTVGLAATTCPAMRLR